MYISVTESHIHINSVQKFYAPEGKLCVVIANEAFGIGINFLTFFLRKSDQLHTSKSVMNYCSNDVLCWRKNFFKYSDYFVQLKGPPTGCQCSDMHTILQVQTV